MRGWLLDSSAAAVAGEPGVAAGLRPLLRAGVLYTCPLLEVAALRTARSPDEYHLMARQRALAYPSVPVTARTGERALELQGRLARADHLDAAGPAHLLVAATALVHDLGVLHQDPAFVVLARLCGLAQRAVAGPLAPGEAA